MGVFKTNLEPNEEDMVATLRIHEVNEKASGGKLPRFSYVRIRKELEL